MRNRLQPRPRPHRTRDSQLAYFLNQLENFDPKLHEPLVSVTWGRDINLRPGITMEFESTSFTRQSFGGAGSLQNSVGNMPWISPETSAILGVSVNGEKLLKPLRPLAREISYTSIELNRSQRTQQPIDVQKLYALNQLYQMNTDQMVYIGSADVGATGLINDADVTATTVANGVSGSPLWINKTPPEMLKDVDTLLNGSWAASAYSVLPSKLLLPPAQYSYLASQLISSAGNSSVLKFLSENSIANNVNGRPLDIQPLKWLPGAGVDGTDRMMVYTNELDRVRFPMVPIRRETAYYQGIRFAAPYVWAFGEMEFVYPETARYADGI